MLKHISTNNNILGGKKMEYNFLESIPELETERLILKPLNNEYKEEIYNHILNSDGSILIQNAKNSILQSEDTYFDEMMRLHSYGFIAQWVIISKVNKEFLGFIQLRKVFLTDSVLDVNVTIDNKNLNNNIASEALSRILIFALMDLKVKRVEAVIDVNNIAAARVMNKCGMTSEGILRDRGTCGDAEMYALTKTDLEKYI